MDSSQEADEQKYFCLRSDDGGCDRRYAWLRYGQYLVEIEIIGRISAEASSDMLRQSLVGVDAPREASEHIEVLLPVGSSTSIIETHQADRDSISQI
ncbi:hypothetical protein ACF9IK_01425 [Kitasatospora hibisci]|uniref:hypothetical protein n=1 Tax=Kitasatospora hibisci TaxID=3369522 RepID=UPI0037545681